MARKLCDGGAVPVENENDLVVAKASPSDVGGHLNLADTLAGHPELVGDFGQGVLSVASDAALTPLGFGAFVDFNGGTLQATAANLTA